MKLCQVTGGDKAIKTPFWKDKRSIGAGLGGPIAGTTPHEQGTGLGLSIGHSIVQDHRSEFRSESEPGKHTRFEVDLRRRR